MDLKQETILVVDDVPENISVLVSILRGAYRVTFATNGADALSAALDQPCPSLILLDVVMPGTSGHEVCCRLKADPRTRDIPVIFLTSNQDPADEEFGLSLGAVDYLHKSALPAVVRQRVRIHLELHNQNLALEDKVRERTQQLEATRIEVVRRLARAGEYRDNETGMHVIRMSHFCHRLALAAGFPAAQADLLKLAAPMHDIGKIGIPDHILLKPGRFTDDERAVMMRHTLIGAEIIGHDDSDLLGLARTVALTHHERWDGTGYPEGLQGDDIPIEGRITAICDVFDALTSARPYKKAWSEEAAVDFIKSQSAGAFDPRLVTLFLGLLPEIAQIRARYADSENEWT